MRRPPQTALAGQARRAQSLGDADPRGHRNAQGFAGAKEFIGDGLRLDPAGRLEVDTASPAIRSGRLAVANVIVADSSIGGVDIVVPADPTAGAIALSIPSPLGNRGRQIVVKNASASNNTITIRPLGGTIDGAVSATITTGWGVLHLFGDGRQWLVI